jgi:hypothetical protein
MAVCFAAAPECPNGTVAAARNGCWTCADSDTCEPLGLPASCGDGFAVCTMPPPECGKYEVAVADGGCWACVNAFTCEGLEGGESTSDSGGEGPSTGGGSSGSSGEDTEDSDADTGDDGWHPCDDGSLPICPLPAPDCEDGSELAVQNGCWQCVDPTTCEPA